MTISFIPDPSRPKNYYLRAGAPWYIRAAVRLVARWASLRDVSGEVPYVLRIEADLTPEVQ